MNDPKLMFEELLNKEFDELLVVEKDGYRVISLEINDTFSYIKAVLEKDSDYFMFTKFGKVRSIPLETAIGLMQEIENKTD